MAISTNGTVLARLAGALYNTQMSNATYSEVKALDPATLADALYARDFANATDTAVATTLVTNLGLSSVAGLVNWVAAQLTAAGSHKGAKIVDLLNGFAQMTADTTYGAYATAFNASVDAALVLSQTTGNAGGTFAAAGSTGVTFTLTTGVDTFSGGSGNDTINATLADGSMGLTGLDAISGGAGTDTLVFNRTAALDTAVAGSSITGVEVVKLASTGTVTSDTTKFGTDVTTVQSSSVGGATLTASASANVTATEADLKASGTSQLIVNGGKDVTVVATGTTTNGTALNTSTGANAEILIGATTAVAGAVNVTSSFKGTNGQVAGDIFVKGGSTVTITQTTTNTTVNESNTQGAVAVVGTAATTAVTVNQDAAEAAAAVVGKVAGAVTITDKEAATTTADTITSVTLKNYGAVAVDSGALNTLSLQGKGGIVTTNANVSTANQTATTLALNLNGAAKLTGGDNTVTVDTAYTTLNVASTGAASTLTALSAAGATTITFSGDKALTLTGNTFTAATAINVTSTAGVSLGSALETTTAFTGGTGADSVVLANASTKAVNLGSGDDTATYGGATGTGGSVTGGDGTDTIKMTGAQANAVDNDSTFNSTFTSFEVLSLTTALDNADNTTINLAGIGGVTKVTTVGVGTDQKTLTLAGMASGGNLVITSDTAATTSGGIAVNVSNATFNAADSFNVTLSKQGVLAGGTVTVADVETVNISAPDATTTASSSGVYGAAAIHTLTLAATSAKSIVVTGNNGLNLTNTGNTAVTSFDASGVVGNDALTTDTAANLGVTFASANTTTSATVVITGGSGNDVLTGNASKDTINGGAGGDIVNGGMGQDTINVGNGHDVIRIISDINVATGANAAKGVQSTTAAADIVNGFVLASAITTAADLSDAAKFIASTAGGANTSMLSIDLNKDNGAADDAGTNVVVSIEANVTTATAAQAVGTTYTVSKGILSLAGSGAAAVDTLAEWLVEANAVSATDGETIAFVFGGDTYVFTQNGTGDSLVQLVGVAATSLVLASATTTATAGAVIIGDSL